MATGEERQPLLGRWRSTVHPVDLEEDLSISSSGLTSATPSVQSSIQDPNKSLMVAPEIGHSVRPVGSSTPSTFPRPNYLSTASSSSEVSGDASNRGRHPDQCSERGENQRYQPVLDRTNVMTSLSSLTQHEQQEAHQSLFQLFKQKIDSNVRLIRGFVLFCGLWACLLLACIALPVGLLTAYCEDYVGEVDVYTNDTVLIEPGVTTFCHSTLLAQEKDAKQEDSIEQQIELYSLSCNKVITSQQKIDVEFIDFNNFSGPFSLYENQFLIAGSTLSVNVSASIFRGHNSVIYTCLFDSFELFKTFSYSEHDWKKYLPDAITCQTVEVNSVKLVRTTAFHYIIKKSGYYFVGLVADGMLAHLDDIHLYGLRQLYIRNDVNRINCTLATKSDSPCEIALLTTNNPQCVLVYARPPQDVRIGYTGLQLTSEPSWTLDRRLVVAVPAAIGVIIIVVYVFALVLCVRKCFK